MRTIDKFCGGVLASVALATFWWPDSGDIEQQATVQQANTPVVQNRTNREFTLMNKSVIVKLRLPDDFLGPAFLKLVQNARAGKTVKILPVLLPCEKFAPYLQSSSACSDSEGERMYVHLYPSVENGVRSFVDGKMNKPWGYYESGDKLYGLKRLIVSGNLEPDVSPYYYEDSEDPSKDVLIRCRSDRCKMQFNSARNVQIEVHTVPVDQLSHWPELVETLRTFIDASVTENSLAASG